MENQALAQYLTLQCAGDPYAVPVLRVREIIPFAGVSKLPTVPNAVRGLINLRGRPVVVLDLSARFGLAPSEPSKRTCVVLVELGATLIGVLTDAVSQVVDLRAEDIQAAPPVGVGRSAEFVSGLGRIEGEFVPILDVDAVCRLDGLIADAGLAASAA
jgi:purine-binding chemotaxis protein CheW